MSSASELVILRRAYARQVCFHGNADNSAISIIPCEGMRDDLSEQALAAAFKKGGFRDVKYLRRTDDLPPEDVWVSAPGWSLAYR